jgi:hypothetical protein
MNSASAGATRTPGPVPMRERRGQAVTRL